MIQCNLFRMTEDHNYKHQLLYYIFATLRAIKICSYWDFACTFNKMDSWIFSSYIFDFISGSLSFQTIYICQWTCIMKSLSFQLVLCNLLWLWEHTNQASYNRAEIWQKWVNTDYFILFGEDVCGKGETSYGTKYTVFGLWTLWHPFCLFKIILLFLGSVSCVWIVEVQHISVPDHWGVTNCLTPKISWNINIARIYLFMCIYMYIERYLYIHL